MRDDEYRRFNIWRDVFMGSLCGTAAYGLDARSIVTKAKEIASLAVEEVVAREPPDRYQQPPGSADERAGTRDGGLVNVKEGEMTLGQASSYVTGAIEYLAIATSEWQPFDPAIPVAPNVVVNWRFRPRRPRKTRVQEMAENLDVTSDIRKKFAALDYETAIREVCVVLRAECKHLNSQLGAEVVERYFFEPR